MALVVLYQRSFFFWIIHFAKREVFVGSGRTGKHDAPGTLCTSTIVCLLYL